MTDEARVGEPRTEAGRAMLNRWGAVTMPPGGYDPKLSEWREAILAIEREAAAAPVDVCSCPLLCCDSHE